jgi:large subunit ribosomal protein L33
MSQDTLTKLECTETGHLIYTRKNKKKIKERLLIKKYNPILRKHTTYKETK